MEDSQADFTLPVRCTGVQNRKNFKGQECALELVLGPFKSKTKQGIKVIEIFKNDVQGTAPILDFRRVL